MSGYYRSNGTYVQGHSRYSHNNWSTKGKTNPHTAKDGTKAPYPTKIPAGR